MDEKLRYSGFLRAPLTSRTPLVDARWKIALETILSVAHAYEDHVEPPRRSKHSPRRHKVASVSMS
jgi:hypothetical protein